VKLGLGVGDAVKVEERVDVTVRLGVWVGVTLEVAVRVFDGVTV
jgi:hypothetical protein